MATFAFGHSWAIGLVCVWMAVCGTVAPVNAEPASPPEKRRNLAAGRVVQFAPAPNYRLTARGGSDPTDLTDGRLSQRADQQMWRESLAVGWSYAGRVNLAMDLGQVCRIDEVAIRLLAGAQPAGKSVPGWIEVVTSLDGEHWMKVAELSRWNLADREQLGLYGRPTSQSGAWIDRLRFEHLDVQARWVGLRMYTTGGGGTIADELYVFGQPVDAAATSDSPRGGEPAAFSITRPQIHFHKPEVTMTTNIATPLPIGLTLPADQGIDGSVSLTLQLPPGVELVAGQVGNMAVQDAAVESLSDGKRQYLFVSRVPESGSKVFGRLYVQAPGWSHGQQGTWVYRIGHDDWQSEAVVIPVQAVEIPPAPRLKRIMVGTGWWAVGQSVAWPRVLDAWRQIGINTFSVVGQWTVPEDHPGWLLLEQARQDGFFIANVDNPISRIPKSHAQQAEIYCQFEDGTTTSGRLLCPAYRGRYYVQEIERFATMMGKVQPHFASNDIEMWTWTGPVEQSQRCIRCQAAFRESGLKTIEQWLVTQGDAIWKDLIDAARQAIRQAGGDPNFQIGGYDFRPGAAYQRVWSVDRLYPEYMQTSQVSTYSTLLPYHLELIGNEVRQDRARMSASDVMPWITPGDAGTFPAEAFQWALLECYANGARGIWFWSGRVWDADHFLAYNRVVRAIAPVEDLIVDGDLVGNAAKVIGAGRVSGIAHGQDMMLLVADYDNQAGGQVRLRLDLPADAVVRDLMTGEMVDQLSAGTRAVKVDLAGQRARLLHVAGAIE